MGEKERDQLIDKTDCEDEKGRKGVCVFSSNTRVCCGGRRWEGDEGVGGVPGLVLSVGRTGRTMGAAGVGRVSHAFALWLGQQACATGVVSPPLACCPTLGKDGEP